MKVGGILIGLALGVTLIWLLLDWPVAEPARLDPARSGVAPEGGSLPVEVFSEPESTDPPAADPGGRQALESERAELGDEPTKKGPRCRILGQVVDTAGAPLAEVPVAMQAVGCPWIAGFESDAYETRTAADGRFEIEAPVPTCDWISLMVQPSRFHALAGRDFGLAGGRNQDPLVEGDNNLGTFTLATTGAIAGRVTAVGGRVPSGARVYLDDSFPGGFSLNGPVDETGRYVIEHVPPGVYGLEAEAEAYLDGHLSSVEVRELAVSEGNDFVLEPSPVISGRVVEEDGTPVENARVHGYPLHSGSGASDYTDEDGRFHLALPQDEAYTFTVEKQGYVTVGEEPPRSLVYEPGTRGIEIVLKRSIQTTWAPWPLRATRSESGSTFWKSWTPGPPGFRRRTAFRAR